MNFSRKMITVTKLCQKKVLKPFFLGYLHLSLCQMEDLSDFVILCGSDGICGSFMEAESLGTIHFKRAVQNYVDFRLGAARKLILPIPNVLRCVCFDSN